MGVLVSSLVLKARGILNDLPNDRFTADEVSEYADGSNTVFRAFNMQLLDIATGGAPLDPVARVNNAAVAKAVDLATGTFTLTAAPAQGSVVVLEYFYRLIDEATYIRFAQQAAEFVGAAPTLTALTDDSLVGALLEDAAVHYMAHLGASKMSSLAGWYYTANAGNKSFDKTAISQAFKSMATDELANAVRARDDVYKRQGQRNAPAYKLATIPFPSYTPPR